MGAKTEISWTDASWNAIRGCSVSSQGCHKCYAMNVAARFSGPGQPYEGLAKFSSKKRVPQWTGKVRLVPKHLMDPIRWTKPRMIFANSMSDMLHEDLPFEDIDRLVAVMAISEMHEKRGGHTFQVLTKRAARLREYASQPIETLRRRIADAGARLMEDGDGWHDKLRYEMPWPLKRVWWGVSVENQEWADKRIPELLLTPAAVRFISYEPALGPLRLREGWLRGTFDRCPDETDDPETDGCRGCPAIPNDGSNGGDVCSAIYSPHLDWVIVGGESGPGARPFDVAWARSIVEQCRDTDVKVFVKQMGANVRTDGIQMAGDWWPDQSPLVEDGLGLVDDSVVGAFRKTLKNKKGGDPLEWPPSLRVRQFPVSAT